MRRIRRLDPTRIDRNLGMEVMRTTEAAALSGGPHMGRGRPAHISDGRRPGNVVDVVVE